MLSRSVAGTDLGIEHELGQCDAGLITSCNSMAPQKSTAEHCLVTRYLCNAKASCRLKLLRYLARPASWSLQLTRFCRQVVHVQNSAHSMHKSRVGPVVKFQSVIAQRAQLLVVLVVADADDGHLAAVDGLYQVCHSASVTARHAIHLIHDQADLQSQPRQARTATAPNMQEMPCPSCMEVMQKFSLDMVLNCQN